MKQIIITILFSICAFALFSQEKTIDEIRNEAYIHFQSDKEIDDGGFYDMKIQPIKKNGTTYLYIVNTEKDGWVIISNEKKYTSVIGYNHSGNFSPDSTTMPCSLRLLLNLHMNNIDSLRYGDSSKYIAKKTPTSLISLRSGSYTIGDSLLIKDGVGNKWNQVGNNCILSCYYDCTRQYNKFCPTFNSYQCGHNMVGCSAVALGQILWYWEWPDYAMIHDSIKHNGDVLGDVRKHFYDWDNIPGQIIGSTSQYKADNIAKLLRDCGYAEHMLYRSTYSMAGLPKIKYAIENYFNFHYETVHDNLIDDFYCILINEINNLRPILCQAWETILSDAHTFVIDGYDSNYNFHINFGWAGYDNAFYDLGFNGYDNNRTFLIEIYPNCTARSDYINGIEQSHIYADSIVTYYSTNNIVINQTNTSVTVENGGHLIAESGSSITLKPGFHAKSGSEVRLSIRDFCTTSGGNRAMLAKYNKEDEKLSTSKSQLIISPNPANDIITITSQEQLENIRIYSITGQCVLQTKQTDINVSTLPAGIYIVTATTTVGNTLQSKFVKM